MVILHHVVEAHYPSEKTTSFDTGTRSQRTLATLIEYGKPGGITAMARTVGLPAALAEEGIEFAETTEPIDESGMEAVGMRLNIANTGEVN